MAPGRRSEQKIHCVVEVRRAGTTNTSGWRTGGLRHMTYCYFQLRVLVCSMTNQKVQIHNRASSPEPNCRIPCIAIRFHRRLERRATNALRAILSSKLLSVSRVVEHSISYEPRMYHGGEREQLLLP
jgi:hypothetical protein